MFFEDGLFFGERLAGLVCNNYRIKGGFSFQCGDLIVPGAIMPIHNKASEAAAGTPETSLGRPEFYFEEPQVRNIKEIYTIYVLTMHINI